MNLFEENGCLSDQGLRALATGQLDELGRLEAAEHLAYCDRCVDRYTALLSAGDILLETPPKGVLMPVVRNIWVRTMQNTFGRCAVAAAAAVLALTLWGNGAFRPSDWKALPQTEFLQEKISVSETLHKTGEAVLQKMPTFQALNPNQGGK